ncbi:hypothetical protein B0A54_17992 [Friedmanniomyces endolithicus]|uniref:F-box domain-containing protein n=1 Tax=Friedmanniomyces endolithicus TaxID=329885 RepID=A0A4U0TMB7_9PEZI|nr:hypothetical protein B0A54_17992 [Friedmanniomyces endolithicus]
MEDSAATSILDLPPEMVGGILATLDKPSQKRFRLVSNVCATLASPLLFGHIYFDFDSGGTNSLIAISRQPKLCRHVHTIELRRRNGLRLFDDINAWRDATVYGYRPAMPGLDDGVVKMTAGSMTQREWDMLTDDAIRRLYDAYESDRKAIVGYTSQLASALSAIVCDKHNRTLVDQGIFSVHRILTDFDGAVARLSHASRFVHDPGYMGDDWGIHWRTVQFHSHGILDGSSIMDDEDIENIQLFAALRSIMLSTNTITSVNLCTRSHAFWSIAHLRRLLDWNERTESRWSPVDAGLEQWIHDIGGPLTACQYIEAATRHLVLVESAFSRLTILECWIDTVGADGSDELATIAGALSTTVIAVAPGDLVSMVIAPPLITNEALSSSAMSVIAHREIEKYTNLFGYNWQQSQAGVGGPNIPLQTVAVNPADLGRPPQPLSYYFGAAGWYCLNADPFALHDQPVSAGLPPGMPCDTIFDDFYAPWVQIPLTARSREGMST